MLTVYQIRDLIERNRVDLFYNSYHWRQLSAQVKKEQHNECQLCKQEGKYSSADIVHHVMHLRKHPELAYSRTYEDEQGTTHIQLLVLCNECHNKVHNRKLNTVKKDKFINEERW